MAKIESLQCPLCELASETYEVTEQSLVDWDNGKGKHIQESFPMLNDDQRERILTGMCSKCWAVMFEEED